MTGLDSGAGRNWHMKSYDIAVIGGDGTGPEVTREALKVSEVAAQKFGFKLNWHHYDFGGDRYLKTGEVLPDRGAAGPVHVRQGHGRRHAGGRGGRQG